MWFNGLFIWALAFVHLSCMAQKAIIATSGPCSKGGQDFKLIEWKPNAMITTGSFPYYGDIRWIGRDTLVIETYVQHVLTLECTRISVKRDLKILSVEYYEDLDNPQLRSSCDVTEVSVCFSFNPFQKELKGLRGQYTFRLKKKDLKGKVYYTGKFTEGFVCE